ncbi:carbohydrate ABC transporter permease [Sulfobacillus harzensis]|uniref:Sugar ABC transporter permease n=1 Tax=Sulfobacillus harzensis TaxID=2729629 RepID=A0A7Y0L662_9FIRM|nr:sugar ABC transporter permease [Sulfobacillus harzensis]NMP23175.1 sugar ABC transporter permease [Sulfobacillus harzensis]
MEGNGSGVRAHSPQSFGVLGVLLWAGIVSTLYRFFHWNIFANDSTFVGLHNFSVLIHQPIFWRSLLNTAYYVVLVVPVTTLLALALALLLREARNLRGGGFSQALVFLPHVTPVVATSIIWVWIFDPNFGLANAVLRLLHLPQLGWLASVHWALPAVMIYTVWHSVGLYTVLFLAGLSTLPKQVMEAAQLDGARGWLAFRRVVLPLISPITFFVIVLATINTMQTFSQIYTLTGGPHGGAGGPAFSTTTDSLLIYQTAFLYDHFSLGSAMSLVLFVLILGMTLIQKLIADRMVFYR